MYVGPETMMPLASAVAAVAGILMVFWRRTVAALRAGARFISRVVSQLSARRSPP